MPIPVGLKCDVEQALMRIRFCQESFSSLEITHGTCTLIWQGCWFITVWSELSHWTSLKRNINASGLGGSKFCCDFIKLSEFWGGMRKQGFVVGWLVFIPYHQNKPHRFAINSSCNDFFNWKAGKKKIKNNDKKTPQLTNQPNKTTHVRIHKRRQYLCGGLIIFC